MTFYLLQSFCYGQHNRSLYTEMEKITMEELQQANEEIFQ